MLYHKCIRVIRLLIIMNVIVDPSQSLRVQARVPKNIWDLTLDLSHSLTVQVSELGENAIITLYHNIVCTMHITSRNFGGHR